MRTLAAGALALLFGGCLKVDAVRCENGAICRSDEACTESPVCTDTACQQLPLCGPPELVSQCLDDANAFGTCDFSSAGNGTCVDRICTQCTPNLAGCGSATAWEVMTPPDGTPALKSVWIDTRTHAYAGGSAGTLLEYDGREWQRSMAFPSTSAQTDLFRIFGTGRDDVYVIATTTEVFHFDGTSWRNIVPDFPPGTATIKAIHGTAKTDIYATGFSGTLIHFNGTTWTTLHGSPGPTFNAVAATPAGAIAVGTNGYVMEYGTGATISQPFTTPSTMAFQNAELVDVFVHGSKVLAAGPPVSAAGNQSTLLELEAGTWSVSEAGLSQLAVFSAADDYLGSDGDIYHYDGAKWVDTPNGPSPTNIRGVSARDGYVLAVGDGPVIWRLRTN